MLFMSQPITSRSNEQMGKFESGKFDSKHELLLPFNFTWVFLQVWNDCYIFASFFKYSTKPLLQLHFE